MCVVGRSGRHGLSILSRTTPTIKRAPAPAADPAFPAQSGGRGLLGLVPRASFPGRGDGVGAFSGLPIGPGGPGRFPGGARRHPVEPPVAGAAPSGAGFR
ncbi:hypothetical protein GCM10018790_63150 [Kitasatospora xanthocidica]|nr:hypothetical protein GCM10018790_63150 [Kitasatospora xanthocidica]